MKQTLAMKLRRAEAKIAVLRTALIGLVGSVHKEELEAMKTLVMKSSMYGETDKKVLVDAINVLIETLEATPLQED